MTNWNTKLLAYLHDPPHCPHSGSDLRNTLLKRLGLTQTAFKAFDPRNDWLAAAADRMIFPHPEKSGLRVTWEANDFEFRHPLGGGILTPDRFPATTAGLEQAFVSALDGLAPEAEDWQHKFIRTWRLWPERSAREQAAHLAYLVADTRLPDHTLWHHNGLASAFVATQGRPAFLLFQIGPVQEFIAQARKTQDLWSASYLLSYLIAQAMLTVAEAIGPDTIIYPQLRGAPLADWYWAEKGFMGTDNPPRLRASHPRELLTPNLPNRFLALVPADAAGRKLAHAAADAVRDSWRTIEESVHDFVEKHVGQKCPGWDNRWAAQVARFPVVDWVLHEWDDSRAALDQAAANTPPLPGGWAAHPLQHAFRWATEMIPAGEREPYDPYSNASFAWALHYAFTDWKFAARKNARPFRPWDPVGSPAAEGVPKDHLDGRNEALGGAHHQRFRELLNDPAKFHGEFKGTQLYGALSLIKRLWPRCYLHGQLNWAKWKPRFESTQDVAEADAFVEVSDAVRRLSDNIAAEEDPPANAEGRPRYYAVLCMDGDNLGQWVAGTRAAPLVNSLADAATKYLQDHWQVGTSLPTAADVQRPLSPGYHAALSEALANFSLYCAGPVVRAFDGQLLYAGGDDVLAMLPAAGALDCAQALQLAFRGQHPDAPDAGASQRVKMVLHDIFDYSRHVAGFLTLRRSARGDVGRAERLKPNWPLMVMGPRASASAGIAIGHVRSPMQDTIQAAREAEATAKSIPGKGAFCLTILKRSGEAVTFAANFQRGSVVVWAELEADEDRLSGRFPYRFLQLIRPLLARTGADSDQGWEPRWTAELLRSVEAELRHVHFQQNESGEPAETRRRRAREQAARWMELLVGEAAEADDPAWQPALSPRNFAHFWMAWAFVNRLEAEP